MLDKSEKEAHWGRFKYLKEFKLLESVDGQDPKVVVRANLASDFMQLFFEYILSKFEFEAAKELGITNLVESSIKGRSNRLLKLKKTSGAAADKGESSSRYVTHTASKDKYKDIAKVFASVNVKHDISRYSISAEPKPERNRGTTRQKEATMIVAQAQDFFSKAKDIIEKGGCRQIVFTGAPGTGKTYVAKKLAKVLMDEWAVELKKKLKAEKGAELDKAKIDCGFVQFHPSYDYTDFVEGIRPIERGENIAFVKVDGVFKKFCRKVVKQGNEELLYFFIIDEMNRANLSKVFGELMFGLEKDKRGKDNRVTTQYHNLRIYDVEKNDYLKVDDDVFAEGFYIPENIVVIGTMNDIDRSVESIDFALRRRFEWLEFVVGKDMLEEAFKAEKDGKFVYGPGVVKNAKDLAESIHKLNKLWANGNHEHGLNRQYDIAQGHFTNLPADIEDLKGVLAHVWEYRIKPLLYEYVRGQSDVEDFVETKCRDAFLGK